MDELDQARRAYTDSADRFRNGESNKSLSAGRGIVFEQAMAQTRMAICLTDPTAPDNPIVFANQSFRELTGYDDDEVIGQNCRFLQGPETDADSIAVMSEAIKEERVIVVELLNYRKDGTPFWNALHLGPIYDHDGKLIYYFGSQWDVTDVRAARADQEHAVMLSRELSHRMKNMFAVIRSIVTMTGREEESQDLTRLINSRIEALARAYQPSLSDIQTQSVDVTKAVRSVLAPYDPDSLRIRITGEALRGEASIVSVLGLTLHELATNAVKHGALSRDSGEVTLDIEGTAGAIVLHWAERGGPAVDAASVGVGAGKGIMETLISASDGSIDLEWQPEGLSAIVKLPGDLTAEMHA